MTEKPFNTNLGTFNDTVIVNSLHELFKNREKVPKDHYFNTFFAYSSYLNGLNEMAEVTLAEFFESSSRGHIEFNKYALICIYEEFSNNLSPWLSNNIKNYIFDDCYSVSDETSTGNNWLFLRALIHLKLYLLIGRERDIKNFEYYADYILSFEHQNMMYDYPPKNKKPCTADKAYPLAYNAKMLSVTIEIYQLLIENEICESHIVNFQGVIQRCVPELLKFNAPDGEALYYGRSDNTLFGYGNLYYILNSLPITDQTGILKSNLLSFINNNYITDGVFKTCTSYCGFRDPYIYDSVYLAYFLFKLLRSRNCELPFISASILPSTHSKAITETNIGYIIRGSGYFYFLSSRGCGIKEKSTDFYGYRYSGLTFMKYDNDKDVCKSFLNLNRNRIFGIGSLYPFVPSTRNFTLKFVYLIYQDVRMKVTDKHYEFSGRCVPEIIIEQSLLLRIGRKITKYAPKINKLLLNFVGYFQRKKMLVRTIIIDKETGGIRMKDEYFSNKKLQYVIPNSWNLNADRVRSSEVRDDCTKYEVLSDNVTINN